MSDEVAASPAGRRFERWTIDLMAGIGLIGCLVFLVLVGFVFFASPFRQQPAAKVEVGKTHETFVVTNGASIARTNLVRLDVRASQAGNPYSSGGGSRDNLRNIVFLDMTNGASRRLLPDNSRRIAEFGLLPGGGNEIDAMDVMATDVGGPSGGKSADAAPPLWYYLVIDATDGSDRQDLIVGSMVGSRQATVLSGIDGIDSIWLRDPTHIALVLRDHRKLFYRIIDTVGFTVAASRPIAID